MATDLIVKSKVREFASSRGYRIGGDALDALSKCVEEKVLKAMERSRQNGRKTIKGYDC